MNNKNSMIVNDDSTHDKSSSHNPAVHAQRAGLEPAAVRRAIKYYMSIETYDNVLLIYFMILWHITF